MKQLIKRILKESIEEIEKERVLKLIEKTGKESIEEIFKIK